MSASDGMSLADWELKLAQTNVAIEKVLQGQSYSMDGVTYNRASLQTLIDYQTMCRQEICQKKEEAAGRGRGPSVMNVTLAGG